MPLVLALLLVLRCPQACSSASHFIGRQGACRHGFTAAGSGAGSSSSDLGPLILLGASRNATAPAHCKEICAEQPSCTSATWTDAAGRWRGVTSHCWLSTTCGGGVTDCCFYGSETYFKVPSASDEGAGDDGDANTSHDAPEPSDKGTVVDTARDRVPDHEEDAHEDALRRYARRYEQDGFVILRSVLSRSEVRTLPPAAEPLPRDRASAFSRCGPSPRFSNRAPAHTS